MYRTFISSSILKTRDDITLIDKYLRKKINERFNGKNLNFKEIIALTNTITSNTINFTFSKTSNNPNTILTTKKANCIGYASLYNSIGNYILVQQQLKHHYKFTHLVGKLSFLGFDIHQFIDTPFFKDHDFNLIKNLKTGQQIYVDPSLSDYFYIDEVTCK